LSLLVKRYFSFLTNSVEPVQTLNRRIVWLVKYGEVVLDRLLAEKQDRTTYTADAFPHTTTSLRLKCVDLISEMQEFRSRLIGDERIDHYILTELNRVLIQIDMIKSDPTDIKYCKILEDIGELVHTLASANELPSVMINETQDDLQILSRLVHIRYDIERYVRKGHLLT
jgi:hypothetical protein